MRVGTSCVSMDWNITLKEFWRGFYTGLFLALLGYGTWTYCSSDNQDSAAPLSHAAANYDVRVSREAIP